MRSTAPNTRIYSPNGSGERKKGVFRALGLGVVTGACDDDPVAIGTYASAGASFGASFLWTSPPPSR
jgi:Mn2+/Fe2+ NRAMP family transporter